MVAIELKDLCDPSVNNIFLIFLPILIYLKSAFTYG